MWGVKGDYRQGASEKLSDDAPIVSVLISKIIQIWGGRQILALEMHKAFCGDLNTEKCVDYICYIII